MDRSSFGKEPKPKLERRPQTTHGEERGFLERIRSAGLSSAAREQAVALLGLFMFTTAACEQSEPDTTAVVETKPTKPPLPPELQADAKRFQEELVTIDGHQNPIDINGVTAEVTVTGSISSQTLESMVIDFQELEKSLDEQGIYLLTKDADPQAFLSNYKDHPKPENHTSTFTVPGYQLSASYSAEDHCLELRNWVDGTTVLATEVPNDLTKTGETDLSLSPTTAIDLMFSLHNSEDDWFDPYERMASYVEYSLGDHIDQFKQSASEPYTIDSLGRGTPFLEAVAKLRHDYPNNEINLGGYTTSLSMEGTVSIERLKALNQTIHAIDAVLKHSANTSHLYPDSQSAVDAIASLAVPDAGTSVQIPRHHIAYTLDQTGWNLQMVITDNVTGQTIVETKVYYNIGVIEYNEEDDAHFAAEDAAYLAEEAAHSAVEPSVPDAETIAEDAAIEAATIVLEDKVNTFTETVSRALRDDKIDMYQTFKRLRATRSYTTYDHDIQLPQIVEGEGMERLRDLLTKNDFHITYSMLPTNGFDQKEAETKLGFESGYNIGEYGGTLFIDGQLTNLKLERTVYSHSADYAKMKPGVSMQRDAYGNMIFQEVEYDEQNQWFNESFNIMLRLPAASENNTAAAAVSIDLSAYALGDYPELLKHVPDQVALILNDQNADYQVYSRVKDLEIETYEDNLKQIAAGAAEAEKMFGFEPGELVRNIIVIDTYDVNAHYAYDKPTSIVINDEYLKHQPLADQWNVGFHETVHLIAHKFELAEDPAMVALYDSLQSSYSPILEDVNEKTWFKEITIGGHAQDNLSELLPSLVRSTLDPNLEASLQKLRSSSRRDYITACETLASTLEAAYTNYDTGTAKPTVHLKLRAAAATAKKAL